MSAYQSSQKMILDQIKELQYEVQFDLFLPKKFRKYTRRQWLDFHKAPYLTYLQSVINRLESHSFPPGTRSMNRVEAILGDTLAPKFVITPNA